MQAPFCTPRPRTCPRGPGSPRGRPVATGNRGDRPQPHLNRSGSRAALALLHLAEFQLDWRRAAKDRHRDLEPGARLIDLLNNAIEGREGTIRDPDLLTDLEGNRRLRPLNAL